MSGTNDESPKPVYLDSNDISCDRPLSGVELARVYRAILERLEAIESNTGK